jgi:imidazole glycerol-phosphate synthase subunit HisF
VSIDYRSDGELGPMVYFDRASKPTGRNPVAWAVEAADRGGGEVMLVDADRDGTGMGLDIDTLSEITSRLSIPVIASGGCGLSSHFSDGFVLGGAEAVSAGTFFAFRDQNPLQTRSQLRNAGVNIRTAT